MPFHFLNIMSNLEKKIREELEATTDYDQKEKLKMKLKAVVKLGLLGILVIPSILLVFTWHGFKAPKSYNGAIYYAIKQIQNETKDLGWINNRTFKKSNSKIKDPVIYYVLLKYPNQFLTYLEKYLNETQPNNIVNIRNLVLNLKHAADNPPKFNPISLACSSQKDISDKYQKADNPQKTTPLSLACSSQNGIYDKYQKADNLPIVTPLSFSCSSQNGIYDNTNINVNEQNDNGLVNVENLPNDYREIVHALQGNDENKITEHEQSNNGDINTNSIEQVQQNQDEDISEILENDFYKIIGGPDDPNQPSADDLIFNGINMEPPMPTDLENNVELALACGNSDIESVPHSQGNCENRDIEHAQPNDGSNNVIEDAQQIQGSDCEDSNIEFTHFFYNPNDESDSTNLENGQDGQVQNNGNANTQNTFYEYSNYFP